MASELRRDALEGASLYGAGFPVNLIAGDPYGGSADRTRVTGVAGAGRAELGLRVFNKITDRGFALLVVLLTLSGILMLT